MVKFPTAVALALFLLVLWALIGREGARAARGAASGGDSLLVYGARIRFQAPSLGPGWQPGLVGKLGDCLTVYLPDPPPPQRAAGYRPVSIDSITAILVSSRFDGRPGADGRPRLYQPGADTTGEAWNELPIGALRRSLGECTPFGP